MFIGRKEELRILRKSNWRDRAELIVVYGRRRVGKTALIEKAYENETVWKFEGIEGGTTQKQIRHLLITLYNYTNDSSLLDKNKHLNSWERVFQLLDTYIAEKELIIFFDEFQWLASMRKQCVSAFKWCWDNYFSKHKKCRFILCGSISSFIVKKVVKSTALYGRVDVEINLKPFSLHETAEFFSKQYTIEEILDIHMTVGGIPQYLSELDPQKSFIQNMNDLAFTKNGYFFQEYQRLFISHFAKNSIYEKILSLVSAKKTVTTQQISSVLNIKSGGSLTQLFDDLEYAGFIERFHPVDKDEHSRLIRIRINDEFLNFYFSIITQNKTAIQQNTVKAYELLTGSVFEQWRGYAFERLCRKHAADIAKALEFSGIRYKSGSWFRAQHDTKIQIDLIFLRADNVVTVCEIKYVNKINALHLISDFERKTEHIMSIHTLPVQKVLVLAKKITLPERVNDYFDTILFTDDIFSV